MNLGIRGRIFITTLGLISCVFIICGTFLELQLRRELHRQLQTELTGYARMAAHVAQEAETEHPPASLQPIARAVGEATRARITFIGLDGLVLADSSVADADLSNLENHQDRPEFTQAQSTGFGTAQRMSTTVNASMLYIAIASNGRIVRAAMPLQLAQNAVARLRFWFTIAGIMGFLLAMVVAGVSSHLMTRTLRRLIENVRSITHQSPNAPGSTARELGNLAGSLNRTAHELDRTIASLGTERDRLETILESMREAVIAVNPEGTISLFNRAAIQLFRCKDSQTGKDLDALEAPALETLWQEGLAGRSASNEFTLRQPKRTVLAQSAPVRTTGGVVMVLHDMTEVRRLEAIRRDFVANVSHELRTPVSVVMANTETLIDGALNEPKHARGLIEAIHRNGERLASLVNDLLDLSRIEAGAYPIELQSVPLNALARRVLGMVEHVAQRKNIDLSMEIPEEALVRADNLALEQVLQNLTENALKYTPEGGHVEITTRYLADDELRIEIRDDGPGIEKVHRERVFQRFYRVDPGRSRQVGGTGLGLSIVKHLTHAMEGEVGVEPNVPHGCIFWVALPAARAETKPVVKPETPVAHA